LIGGIEIFTDGACSGNPGPGGWAAILRRGKREQELSGGELQTTNNRMELTAVIEAMKFITNPMPIKIYTDSKYVMDGAQQWLPVWKVKGWKTADRKPVKNDDLWKTLDAGLRRFDKVEWEWIRGHSGHPENERADQLARSAIINVLAESRKAAG
jgi:ribonuclease HI